MDPHLTLSILAGKATKAVIKLKGGGATAAPGLYSLKFEKNALNKLSKPLERTILISGTNGKTTTTRLVGSFLDKVGTSYIHNRHGSNLERGLVSTLLEAANLQGEIKLQTAVFEVDEATLASVLPKLKPTVIVLTNLFRDQLDRYGEVDNIKKLWEKTFISLNADTKLVLNADDPSVAHLGKDREAIYFGLADPKVKLEATPTTLDSDRCPECQSSLHYQHYYSSHQGDYVCKNCGFKRPKLIIAATNIILTDRGSEFELRNDSEQTLIIRSKLPGLYNVYNVLAAYSCLRALGLELDQFASVVSEFGSVFGRGEKLQTSGKNILVALAKNPTGFNEIIRTFLKKDKQSLLIIINDKIADGRDVSWLWDVEFEKLAGKNHSIAVAGVRAADMALRLKYAGLSDLEVYESLEQAVEDSLDKIEPGQTLTIVPTYTAMLELKRILAKKKIGGEFWED